MAISDIEFQISTQGLGRAALNEDGFSGFVYLEDSLVLPTGTSDNWESSGFETLASVQEAEARGLTSGWSDGRAHYYISEYFRMSTSGNLLYVSLQEGSGTASYDLTEIVDLQEVSENKCRQILCFVPEQTTVSLVETAQAISVTLSGEQAPLRIVLDGLNDQYADYPSIPDLTGNDLGNVFVTLGADIGAVAGITASAAGTKLGLISSKAVHESTAWVETSNIKSGIFYDNAGLVTGELLTSLNKAALSSIENKSWIPLRKFPGNTGVYFSDFISCDVNTSDFKKGQHGRVMDKVQRLLFDFLVPDLNRPLVLNGDDGTLTEATIQYFRAKCNTALEKNMLNQGEISAFEITIQNDQDVLSNETLEITVDIVPIGQVKHIVFKLNFVPNLG